MMLPKARPAEELIINPIGEELVVYDRQRSKAHSLNPTAAFVFEHLDGQTSLTELSALLVAKYTLTTAQASDLMWLSLDRLEKAHLLQGKIAWPAGIGHYYTRRQILKTASMQAALLPVVVTIMAPTPAQADSPPSPSPG
jgi:hypothetical protein